MNQPAAVPSAETLIQSVQELATKKESAENERTPSPTKAVVKKVLNYTYIYISIVGYRSFRQHPGPVLGVEEEEARVVYDRNF